VANAEARTVAHNLAHPYDLQATDHRFVPFAIFADPQIAWFGPTRPELDAAGIAYVGATADYADVAYGWAMEDTTGFLTVYADPATGQIIAAHCAGYQASMVLQPVLTAAAARIPAHQAARMQYWPHPSLTEVAENALLNLEVNCS
jgi:mycothione reductase